MRVNIVTLINTSLESFIQFLENICKFSRQTKVRCQVVPLVSPCERHQVKTTGAVCGHSASRGNAPASTVHKPTECAPKAGPAFPPSFAVPR